ncbi:hypothetical protein RclHR1_10340002 [Rhizophagus clarus]|uniref:Uncharacterized protein n=1 Tax=Rhizophagus clarus TaxID=94130 RepID=A0A2Z6QD57_9GLOM|nr:hypothetical protein RclHR1_10340002 [Rhizophagus clarus]
MNSTKICHRLNQIIISITLFTNLSANISDDEVLSIRTNIKECRVGALLNKNWKQLSNVGEGYFLESVMICFSPEDVT